jgi:K+-transporting ATPase ATPase C chain
MLGHLRANLLLVFCTVILCSVLYPLALWVVGQTFFHEAAEGSVLLARDGKPVGSRLIAQPFTGDAYFQPRPSAASYRADASGASNFGASNPLLRDRVARQLGPIARYRAGPKAGQPVGPDIEAWFQQQPPGFVKQWAVDHSSLAEQWIKDNAEAAAAWLKKTPDEVKAATADSARELFASFGEQHPSSWPAVEEVKTGAEVARRIKPAREGTQVQAYLFDPWLWAHSDADLEQVPADMVMTSGSGLDPHITLKNALDQLDRVAAGWAARTGRDKQQLGDEIRGLLEKNKESPLGGLVGVPLVNVLEMNLALEDRYGR